MGRQRPPHTALRCQAERQDNETGLGQPSNSVPAVLPAGAAWALGIAGARAVGVVPACLGAAALAAPWYLARGRRGFPGRLLLVAALSLAAGAARQGWAMGSPPPDYVARYIDSRVVLRGTVGDEAWIRDGRASYRVDTVAVAVADAGPSEAAWRPTRGRILVQTGQYPPLGYGDGVIVTGTLEAAPVFEGFDYRAYLARRGVGAVMWRPGIAPTGRHGGHWWRRRLLDLKGRGRSALARALPEPESSLAVGILLGDARGIPEAVDQAFRRTNTTHIIAISGSNVALVVAVLMATLGRGIGRRRAAPVTLAALVAYTALVGADAAVVRAALMGAVALLGLVVRRPSHAATALVASGWVMTAYRPAYLWDLGFQLSFAATVGLVMYSARFSGSLEAALTGRVSPRLLGRLTALANEAVLLTLAAQLTT
ncbi:MAG: ComEC/Rec2 family competence protein, partial [Anaerolineae bacterium]